MKLPAANGATLKKDSETREKKSVPTSPGASGNEALADADPDEALPEYDFRGAVRGKYVARYAEGTNVVLLDPDVAAAFPDSAAVNSALRALIQIARRGTKGQEPAA